MTFRLPEKARHAAVLAIAAINGMACLPSFAATLRVGPGAGDAGSACQFARPQAAVDALPDNGGPHRIELEAGIYTDADAAILVAGRQVHIATVFAEGSGCSIASQDHAVLSTAGSTLADGRTVVVEEGGSLILERTVIRDSRRGGLLVRNASAALLDSVLEENRSPASSPGAGARIESGALAVSGGRLTGNVSGGPGGALYCTRATQGGSSRIDLHGPLDLDGNEAGDGGAIHLARRCGLAIAGDVRFAGNRSRGDGGALSVAAHGIGADDRNSILFDGTVRFEDNVATGAGGGVWLPAGNALEMSTGTRLAFHRNRAGKRGGAITLEGPGWPVALGNAVFADNRAGLLGGAVAVEDREFALLNLCAHGDVIDERYCARFDGNGLDEPAPGTATSPQGGSLYAGGGARLLVDGYAFRRTPPPPPAAPDAGALAAVDDTGLLRLRNVLVFDTSALPADASLLEARAGGLVQLFFSTIVDTPGGSVLHVGPDAVAQAVGSIVAGNAAGIVNQGLLYATCSNLQTGAAPAPIDPGFITTPAGRYRLGADSPMTGLGLTCEPAMLPAGFEAPAVDLDGHVRLAPGEPPMTLDLGAFEFRPDGDAIFGSGFETVPAS